MYQRNEPHSVRGLRESAGSFGLRYIPRSCLVSPDPPGWPQTPLHIRGVHRVQLYLLCQTQKRSCFPILKLFKANTDSNARAAAGASPLESCRSHPGLLDPALTGRLLPQPNVRWFIWGAEIVGRAQRESSQPEQGLWCPVNCASPT